jgi:ribosome-binding protein aMBF1 (putative translation factor)
MRVAGIRTGLVRAQARVVERALIGRRPAGDRRVTGGSDTSAMQASQTVDTHASRDPIRRWGTDDTELAEAYGLRMIGEGVRRARAGQGISQRQLGWRVGLHQSTISRLETGRLRTMRMVTLARVMGVLRLGVHHLFPGEPPQPSRRLPAEQAASPRSASPNSAG